MGEPSGGIAAAGRMFAPAIGVAEDIVNANSAGCLAAHLLDTGRYASVEVHQGDTLGRPSTVLATATRTPEGITARGGGLAHCLSGEPDIRTCGIAELHVVDEPCSDG